MKSFAWMVLFPILPWVLGFSAALGCDLSGVNANPWWIPVAVLTIAGVVSCTWYGQKRGYEELY